MYLTLMGHLGKDPQIRFTQEGKKLTVIRLACNQYRNGQEETLWWRVTIWGNGFDKFISYLKKGSALIACGEMLKPEIYTDKNGVLQVSLSMRAYRLSFPSLGKKETQQSFDQIPQDFEESPTERSPFEESFKDFDDGNEMPF